MFHLKFHLKFLRGFLRKFHQDSEFFIKFSVYYSKRSFLPSQIHPEGPSEFPSRVFFRSFCVNTFNIFIQNSLHKFFFRVSPMPYKLFLGFHHEIFLGFCRVPFGILTEDAYRIHPTVSQRAYSGMLFVITAGGVPTGVIFVIPTRSFFENSSMTSFLDSSQSFAWISGKTYFEICSRFPFSIP